MGTNYYAVRNKPTTQEPIHIGKSSAGWLFCFQRHNDTWSDPPVVWNTWTQIKTWLKENTVDKTDYVIIDEYDEVITLDDFIEMVEEKQRDKFCKANKDNFTYSDNVDGYRFSNEDFC